MGIDPVTGAVVASSVLQGIGGALGASSQNRQAAKNREELRRQFNLQLANNQYQFGRQQQLPEGEAARSAQFSIQAAPLRDRAAYLLAQRMGMSPGAFQAGSRLDGQAPQAGGIDAGAMQQANAAYRPGAGGIDPRVERLLLERLGYGPKAAAGTRPQGIPVPSHLRPGGGALPDTGLYDQYRSGNMQGFNPGNASRAMDQRRELEAWKERERAYRGGR